MSDTSRSLTDTFATVGDLEARWRPLDKDEAAKATVLLEDATDLIKTTCPRWEQATEATRRRVTCAAVKRALMGDTTDTATQVDGGIYISQPRGTVASETHTGGPFSDSFTYANPDGGLFLRKAEIEALGGRRGGAFEVDLLASTPTRSATDALLTAITPISQERP